MTEPQESPKASWPLIVVAVLSFIPSIGLLFAAVAVAWGLISDRPRARLAVILGIAGAALSFVEMFALMFFLGGSKGMSDAQAASARAELGRIVVALEDYRRTNGSYPPDLPTLVGRPIPRHFVAITDQTASVFSVRPYHYEMHEDGTYDVFGVGPDGRPFTDDDVRPQLSDSLAAHSGYRPAGAKRPH